MDNVLKSTVLALFLATASPAHAADIPDPIHGVSFDEWASAAGRLAQGMPEPEMLTLLDISVEQWQALNEAFTEELSADETFELIGHFGEVFNDPTAGRFGGVEEHRAERKLKTVEDWIKFQQKMHYATVSGADPQDILAEADMTIFDFTQENAYWIDHIHEISEDQGANPGDEDHPFFVLQDSMAHFNEVYGRRYAKEYGVPYEGE